MQPQWHRLCQITRVMSELALLRSWYRNPAFWHADDKLNILWGELDWFDELHRLLHEFEEAA